jgi:hypothetical protein
MVSSKEKFFRKHYGPVATGWTKRACRLLQRRKPLGSDSGYRRLEGVSPDTRFEASAGAGKTRFLFQISVNPLMFPAAGAVSASPCFRLPPEVFESLGRGFYYAQMVDLTDNRILENWQWQKI